MKILEDNFNHKDFAIDVICHKCKSKLRVNKPLDINCESVTEGETYNSYTATRYNFVCPLCMTRNRISREQEKQLPESVKNSAIKI
jgi:hypothetical protein